MRGVLLQDGRGTGCLVHGGALTLRRSDGTSSVRLPNRNPARISSFLYQRFLHFAFEKMRLHADLSPLQLQEKFSVLKASDGRTELRTLSFHAPKIRYMRSLAIDGGPLLQVLDFAAFPEPEFDLPIFCANFFTAAERNIVVLDLNPLHDVINNNNYKEKYYRSLLPLGQKYAELFPWGDQITAESIRFFSPIVLWTRFASSQEKHDILYSAFKDYFQAWLELLDRATADADASHISVNREAQHKYLTWRTEKDPGRQILQKLVGESFAEELVRDFLFYGVDSLGSKKFLDFFPQYRCEDGTINKKRSIIGNFMWGEFAAHSTKPC
ncbi:phytochromobilin:ferredoxin oxidoreductase, chloroplastic isoform X2 [Nymphaea colorata]|uniref:phytochromobilin:ferredoxin oxidoreductase, chloroplastic isoform X2 n=1 Tax=Nymphaea colorata TaxID=210225 RepID=UPI00129E140C|nr:phytochromobilin:ferredoxin oxidoreductase, chloroplastic isoform X2 [Nymphaea colorata]